MLRLVKAVPGLRMLIVALVHSLPSIGYIGLLLLIEMYVYAVVGSFLFGESDPEHFGNFAVAMQTLTQVITFDDWAVIMRSQTNQLAAIIYFVSFILLGTMVILNLFIGVIMEGFTSAREQFAAEQSEIAAAVMAERDEVESELARIQGQLSALAADMNRLTLMTQRARTNGDAGSRSARVGEQRPEEYARP
jgi:voltage-gated sodium channel